MGWVCGDRGIWAATGRLQIEPKPTEQASHSADKLTARSNDAVTIAGKRKSMKVYCTWTKVSAILKFEYELFDCFTPNIVRNADYLSLSLLHESGRHTPCTVVVWSFGNKAGYSARCLRA